MSITIDEDGSLEVDFPNVENTLFFTSKYDNNHISYFFRVIDHYDDSDKEFTDDPSVCDNVLESMFFEPTVTVVEPDEGSEKDCLDFIIGDRRRDYFIIRVFSEDIKITKAIKVVNETNSERKKIWINTKYPYGKFEDFKFYRNELIIYTSNSEITFKSNVRYEDEYSSEIIYNHGDLCDLIERRIVDFDVNDDTATITFDDGDIFEFTSESNGGISSWIVVSVENV